jgi:alpha-glucosidase (family GH31 glycosyl hydrolase)
LPTLPPLWALGWHASEKSWKTLEDVRKTVENYNSNGLPLEAIELHGRYMQNYSSFTVDSTNFDQLKEFTDQLHQAGRRLVLVLFGGLSNEQPPNKYRILA